MQLHLNSKQVAFWFLYLQINTWWSNKETEAGQSWAHGTSIYTTHSLTWRIVWIALGFALFDRGRLLKCVLRLSPAPPTPTSLPFFLSKYWTRKGKKCFSRSANATDKRKWLSAEVLDYGRRPGNFLFVLHLFLKIAVKQRGSTRREHFSYNVWGFQPKTVSKM